MPEKTPAQVVHGNDEKEHGAQRVLHGLQSVFKRTKPPAPPEPHQAQTPAAAQEVAASVGAPSGPPAGVKDEWSVEYITNTLPSYALKYAPFVYLDKGEEFWPGNVIKHVEHCTPQDNGGIPISVSEQGIEMLNNSRIRDDSNTYFVLDKDPRQIDAQQIDALTSREGKPDESRQSASTVYIITVDKSKDIGEGFVDVFYFYFYPYNYGTAVVGIHFGNHIGDWEHTMVRFRFGVPIYVHLSAHSDGHSYKFDVLEKLDGRPVVYAARGSHANYATAGSQRYSGIPGGPVDVTSKGFLWDPTLNYVSVNNRHQDGTLTAHQPWPQAPNARCEPFPTPTQTSNIMRFQGRWGNSFYEYRRVAAAGEEPRSIAGKLGQKLDWFKDKVEDGVHRGEAQKAAENRDDITMNQKYYKLVWGEGPTGPRDKSLNRCTMNRNDNNILDKL